jgi:hypothetical protein
VDSRWVVGRGRAREPKDIQYGVRSTSVQYGTTSLSVAEWCLSHYRKWDGAEQLDISTPVGKNSNSPIANKN